MEKKEALDAVRQMMKHYQFVAHCEEILEATFAAEQEQANIEKKIVGLKDDLAKVEETVQEETETVRARAEEERTALMQELNREIAELRKSVATLTSQKDLLSSSLTSIQGEIESEKRRLLNVRAETQRTISSARFETAEKVREINAEIKEKESQRDQLTEAVNKLRQTWEGLRPSA